MPSWHDYHLTGYSVDGQRQRLVLDVKWLDEGKVDLPHVHIAFVGVEGYSLRHDLGVNIILELEEGPLDRFLRDLAPRFAAESKWGWPMFWRGDTARTLAYLEEKRAHCFYLSASYGMDGWIVAAGMEHHTVGESCCR